MTENQICTAECRHCTPEEMRENAKRLLDALASRGSVGLIYASSLAHGKCREFSKAIEIERYRRGWVDVYAFKTIGCPAYVYEALRCEQGLPEKTEAALRRYEGLNRVPVALPAPKSELGVFVERDKVWTTSRDVAAKFEKPHDKVLRSIRTLDCSKEFTAANFGVSEYKDPTGRTLPQYLMTRDGFTFLAMGFTGPKAINDHCRGVTKRYLTDALGRNQEASFIPEGDVYRLVCGSKLPSAERFERWVFDEVLPSIRKHGLYAAPATVDDILGNPDAFIRILQEIKDERAKNAELSLQNAKQAQIIHEMKPKADYTDRILQNRGLVTITQIAKDYGMSGEAMNALLHELGVQYKQSEQWLLYAKYQSKGYTHSHTIDIVRSDGSQDVKMSTKWTQKGRLFLYNLLKEHGTLPMIEV